MSGSASSVRSGDSIDRGGQIEVLLGDTPGVMCRQREADAAPADVDVGVMVRLLGGHGHLVDDRDGGGEVGSRDRPLE